MSNRFKQLAANAEAWAIGAALVVVAIAWVYSRFAE
jgi:hypothetical protein